MLHFSSEHTPEEPSDRAVSAGFDGISAPGVTPTSNIIEVAEATTSGSTLPSRDEQNRFLARCAEVLRENSTSLKALVSLTHEALDLRSRVEGDQAQGTKGILIQLDSRLEWYKQGERVLIESLPIVASLYQQSPAIVIETMVTDFLNRLGSEVPRLLEPHAATAIASCLEQNRLMMIFAARALKSQDHVQEALGGLKERSFADTGGSTASTTKSSTELRASDRQAAFEARRAERAAATEARKEALRNGGSLPVRGAKAPPPVDSEKSELLAATAGQHRSSFDSARPTEEQQRLLTQRKPKELESTFSDRLTSSKGDARAQELETVRTEVTNALISRLSDWLRTEVDIAKSLRRQSLSAGDIPTTAQSAHTRLSHAHAEHSELRSFLEVVQKHLAIFARAVVKHQEKCKGAFTPLQWATLERIVNPEKPRETYELAD
jgi:hypothetical protein